VNAGASFSYSGPYLLISASALGSDYPITKTPSQTEHLLSSSLDDIKPWLGYQLLGLGIGMVDEHVLSERELLPNYEINFLELGAGFSPPLAVGIWGRFWLGGTSWDVPALSLRLSYSPYMSFKDWGKYQYRSARLDLFVERGINWFGDPCFRSGISAEFTLNPLFPDFIFEAGWVRFERWETGHSGPYLLLMTTILGSEFIIGKKIE
jgi:hypothetical protein